MIAPTSDTDRLFIAVKILVARALTSRPPAALIAAATRRKPSRSGVVLDLRDSHVPTRLIASIMLGLHEKAEAEYVRKYIRPGDRVIELGACVGFVSASIARRVGPTGHLTLVEPNPVLQPTLRKSMELNSACPYQLIGAAIGYDDRATYRSDANLTGGRATNGQSTGGDTTVQTVRLSDLDQEATVLVSDIEGGEWELLDHEPASLQKFELIIAELHPTEERTVLDFVRKMTTMGFDLVDSNGPVVVLKNGAGR